MTLAVQHVRLANASDRAGALIFDGDVLLGVAAQLSPEHGERAGGWFLEIGFGPRLETREVFVSLEDVCAWIQNRRNDPDPSGPGGTVVDFKPR